MGGVSVLKQRPNRFFGARVRGRLGRHWLWRPAERRLKPTPPGGSGLGSQAALESEKDEVGAAANSEFVEQVGDVKFHGALGDVEFAGDFLVGKILEERIENFLFATAEIGDGIGLQATRLIRKNGIDETGQHGARHPETAVGDERQGANELLASFFVGKNPFHTETQERKAVGILMLIADDDEARVGETLDEIGQKRTGRLARSVRVHDINLSFGRFEVAEVGSER